MFENIIGQPGVVEELTRDIRDGRLPASMLFHGPDMSAKLTTALELARVLMCGRNTGEWGCDCPACRQNRLLENPYLLLLGWRNFEDEIRAVADVLRRCDGRAVRFLFVRGVRKLIKRFDGVLWEGAENKAANAFEMIREIEELMEPLLPDALDEKVEKKESILDKVIELSAGLIKKAGMDGIPVHQIRKASYWAHTTSGGNRKVVILENADRMLPGAANALLKTLEEPPPGTYFMLLSSKKERIMPTLRSRLRQFQFNRRNDEVQAEILRRVFRDTSGKFKTLESFFLTWGIDTELVSSARESFLKAISERTPDIFFADDRPYAKELADGRFFKALLDAVGDSLQERYRRSGVGDFADRDSMRKYELWVSSLRKQQRRMESYNMNPMLLLHSLYKEVAIDS